METVVLTIHVLIVVSLIGVVLLQRSEGGALGMGAGSGGGFMTGRGAANALTRTTSILAALFFATSLGLAFFAGGANDEIEVIEGLTGDEVRDPTAPVTADDLFNTLGSDRDDDDAGSELTIDPDAQSELDRALDSLSEAAGASETSEAAPEETSPEGDASEPESQPEQ